MTTKISKKDKEALEGLEKQAAIEAENKMIADDNLDINNENVDIETGEITDIEKHEIIGVASTYLTNMYATTCMSDIGAYKEGGAKRQAILDLLDYEFIDIGQIIGKVTSTERAKDNNDKEVVRMAGSFEIRRDDGDIVKGSQLTLPLKAAGAIAEIMDTSPDGFIPLIYIKVSLSRYHGSPTGYSYGFKVKATAPPTSMFDDNPFLLPEK